MMTGNKSFMQPIEKAHHALMRGPKVPQVVPQMFTIACQMYLTWFAQSSTLIMYMN
jgi:hypothetical protein